MRKDLRTVNANKYLSFRGIVFYFKNTVTVLKNVLEYRKKCLEIKMVISFLALAAVDVNGSLPGHDHHTRLGLRS